MSMNYLFLADAIFPDSMGGSHRYLYELVTRLANNNNVYVIVPNICNKNVIEKQGNLTIFRYTLSKNKIKKFFEYQNKPIKIIKKYLNNIKIDVVNSHWALVSYKVYKYFSKKNAKLVHYMHGPIYEEYSIEMQQNNIVKNIFINKVKKIEIKNLNIVEKVFVASNYMKSKAINCFGVLENKITIIPCGCDYEKFDLKKKKSTNDIFNILTIRRIKKRMGLDLLIDAILLLKDKYNVQLSIGGKGDYLDEIKHKVDSLKINNVNFLGFIPEKALVSYYQKADLFVIPSLDLEGFGMVTLEALSCGTPVVGTPVGGNIEILSKLDKELIAEEVSAKSLADAISRFIDSNKKDPDYYRKFVIDNFSWTKVVNMFEKETR